MKRNLIVTVVVLLAGMAIWMARHFWGRGGVPLPSQPRSTEQVARGLRETVEPRLKASVQRSGVTWPPKEVTLLAFKEERSLEVWARDETGRQRQVVVFPIFGASGVAGPKLREGDMQVPEGIYGIELLNPNSRFHLSLRVNYPNADDMRRARKENRDMGKLGGDIMIHGGDQSIGCLAIGDEAIEELFYLAACMSLNEIELIIAPRDFRRSNDITPPEFSPEWTGELYSQIAKKLGEFQRLSD